VNTAQQVVSTVSKN